jgi:two-component system, cell cycle sensor histidine kinase and response regulator CckA
MESNNRILVIDDNAAIHDDFRKILCANVPSTEKLNDLMSAVFGESTPTGPVVDFQLESAFQGQEGLAKVERSLAENRPYAMAFVDVRMPPGWDGIETITHIWKVDPSLQVVICTAYSDYSWQEIFSQLGRSDQLVVLKKPFDSIEVLQLAHAMTRKWLVTQQAGQQLHTLDRLVRARTHELHSTNEMLIAEISQRELAQNALKASEERLSNAFKACPLPIAILRLHDHGCVDLNHAFLESTGFAREEMIGRSPWESGLSIDAKSRLEAMAELAQGQAVRQRDCQIHTKAGETRAALLWMEPFELASGAHVLAIVQDVSDRQKLEAELRQSQKMEAIGHLAAGVAHDLNNILTVVDGHTSLQLAKTKLDEDVAWSLQQMQGASQRAGALTRQLLAFSRKQVMQKRVISLDRVITNITAMLSRLIPSTIALTFEHAPELPATYADICNIEQIIVNLVVNARDAMPEGGKLTIRTDVVEITAARPAQGSAARPGSYVRMSVSDTGSGMSKETLARIFEPFFTTKEVGKGTGMGLATVTGIVQQHDGFIDVQSIVGQGTTFQILLPVTQQVEVSEATAAPQLEHTASGEMIMLVEDDADVRMLARCVLEDSGYEVLEAADGHLATEVWRSYPGRIDLLLTDMVMPGGLSGTDVAQRFLADRPEGKVVFTSGYSVELFGDDISTRAGFNFLPKPYLARQLIEALTSALTNSPAQPASIG